MHCVTEGLTETEREFVVMMEAAGVTVVRCAWPPGWPDFLCIGRQGRPYFVEVKVPGGSLRPSQRLTIDSLLALGIPVFTWRPAGSPGTREHPYGFRREANKAAPWCSWSQTIPLNRTTTRRCERRKGETKP